MSPTPIRFSNNLASSILGENYNALVPTVDNFAAARLFVGEPGMRLYVAGTTTPGDGGQGMFSWTVGTAAPTSDALIVNAFPAAYWSRLSESSGGSGGTGYPVGLATGIAALNLNSGSAATLGTFVTSGYRTVGDIGAATYYRNAGAARTGDQVSADGVRLSLVPGQRFYPQMFGAYADTTTGSNGHDDWQAITDAQNNSYTKEIWFQGLYRSSKTVQEYGILNEGARHFRGGSGGGLAEFTGPPWIFTPTNSTGMIIHCNNTTANSTGTVMSLRTPDGRDATGTVVDRIHFASGNGTQVANGGWVATIHGIRANTRCELTNNVVTGFRGNGINIVAAAGSPDPELTGNANECTIRHNYIANIGMNGIYYDGPDSNGGDSFGNLTVDCYGFGIFDSSFLGNYHYAHRTQSMGFGSVCSYAGNQYYLVGSPSDGISTTPGTNANVWVFLGVGGVTSIARDWNLHGPWIEGGPRAADNLNARSVWLGVYDEQSSTPQKVNYPSAVLFGIMVGNRGNGLTVANADISNLSTLIADNVSSIVHDNAAILAKRPLASTSINFRAWNYAGPYGSSIALASNYRTDGVTPLDSAAVRSGGIANEAGTGWGALQYWDPGNVALTDLVFWGTSAKTFSPLTDLVPDLGQVGTRWKNGYIQTLLPGAGVAKWTSQSGTPEGSLTSVGGAFVTDTATGLGYLKTTVGSGNTGYKQITIAGAYTAAPLTMATARLLGRTTASTGSAEEITVGNGLLLSSGSLTVTPAAHQANSTAPDVATLVTDFNALLAKLQAAGLMA